MSDDRLILRAEDHRGSSLQDEKRTCHQQVAGLERGGHAPRWSANGKELYDVEMDGRLVVVPIHVSPDGKSIDAGASTPLFMTRLATGAGVGLGSGPYSRANYSVAPDGRFLMNVDTEKPVTSPITIMLSRVESRPS